MRKMSAAALADEADQLAEIRKAHMFSASIRLGPHDKRTRYFQDDNQAIAYREAREAADEMNADSRFGRRAIVYAINKLGSFAVDERLAAAAGLI